MRNHSTYACTIIIRIVVCFSILAFAYKFNFPPFMVFVIALLNDGATMALWADRVLPSMTSDSWDLAEIFAFAVAYGLYFTLPAIILAIVILETTFFQDKFGADLEHEPGVPPANNRMLHMITHLQVAIISQALIFITRSHNSSS